MFTAKFQHTFESIREHLEKLFDIQDDTQADVLSLRADLRSALNRIEALESEVKYGPATSFGSIVPERPQRIDSVPMIPLSESQKFHGEGRPAALESITVHVPIPEGDTNKEVSILQS